MTLATFTDANDWLDGTKISFTNAADALPEATEADRVVRALLYDAFPDNVNEWDESGTPEATPAVVRAIAGLLMAAYRYQKRYSEETTEPNNFAATLEARAMSLIEGLRSGSIELNDVTYTSGLAWSSNDFWPNNSTVYEGTSIPIRAFTMEQEF